MHKQKAEVDSGGREEGKSSLQDDEWPSGEMVIFSVMHAQDPFQQLSKCH